MATLMGSIRKLVNETSTQAIDREIPKMVSDLIKTAVGSTFKIVEAVLEIVRDVTKEETPAPSETTEETEKNDPAVTS